MKSYWQVLHVECDAQTTALCWIEDHVVFGLNETKTFAKSELMAQGWKLSMRRDVCPKCREVERGNNSG